MASSIGGVTASSGEGSPDSSHAIGTENEHDKTPSLSRDDTFEILSNHRRRFALHHLQRNEEQAQLGELSERVAAWENDIDVNQVSSTERKRVYTSLQQFHLPKMDEKGIVEFDNREGIVELTPVADDVDIYLEVVEDKDIPWSQYYLALSAVNLGLFAAVLAGTYPLRLVPTAGWALFVITTFMVSALVHTYFNRTEMQLGNTSGPPEVER